MKIWNAYGSEHSMNLVMIGHFKSEADAEATQELIEKLSEGLRDKVEIGSTRDRFSSEILAVLSEAKFYSLSPPELEHFLHDVHTEVKNDKLILTTDESEVSAFFKLMMHKGARVEVFSAHDYPDEEFGRGK